MKKVLKLACILLLALMIFKDAKAQFSAGGGILYGFDLERVGIRADGLYTINESWRAGGDFGYYFPKSEFGAKISWWELNLNAHFVFLDNDDFRVYALAGINYITVSFSDEDNPPGNIPGVAGFARTMSKENGQQVESPVMALTSNASAIDFSGSDSETGLNLGIGGEYKVSFGSVFSELKYAGIAGAADQIVFGAGVRYDF